MSLSPTFSRLFGAALFATVLLRASAQTNLPAFPGAEGFGAWAAGGRGGDVYHVVNLASSGAGSFADGLATVPPAGRTIVFDVSGYIRVNGTLTLDASKVTIAGQTAPGDGIGITNGTFKISSSDVIFRQFRFRDGHSADALNIDSDATNTILDHCDTLLGKDENFSSFRRPPENVTFQWSINAWGMERHSCGGLWDQRHATAHYTLWAHNHTRNPKARPDGCLDWVNNVTFDWDIGFIMGDSPSPANWKANVRGSYFICPPGNIRSVALEKANLIASSGLPNFSLYLDDCALDANGDGVLNASKTGYSLASGSYTKLAAPLAQTANGQPISATNPIVGVPVKCDDYLTAYKKIVSQAGPVNFDANPARPFRDELSSILIKNLVTQRRHHVSTPAETGAANGGFGFLNPRPAPADTDRDGMPDFWEATLGLNVAVDDHNGLVPSSGGFVTTNSFFPPNTLAGYTWLEEYLHFLASPHATVRRNTTDAPTAVDLDLRRYTSGFTNGAVFTLSRVAGGTVSQSGTGGCLAHFVPPPNTSGRAWFDFKVVDAQASEWTQTFSILASALDLPGDLMRKGGASANTR